MTHEDFEKSWLGDAAKRAKAAAKAKRQSVKDSRYQDWDPSKGPRQDVIPANFDKKPNRLGVGVGAGVVGTAGAGGYYMGTRPKKQPVQPQMQAPVVKSYYTDEEIAKFAALTKLKSFGGALKSGAKKHSKALNANPRAYGQNYGAKAGTSLGNAYGRAKNYLKPGGTWNKKRVAGVSTAGVGTLGAGYMIGKAEKMPADEYSARRRDTSLGLGSNALGATVGAVATGQAGYVAHQHFKNKKEKAGKPPSHELATRTKPPSAGAKLKNALGSKKATAVLVPAALVANIPFQAGNAAADANSAKFFAQERKRLKDVEVVKNEEGLATCYEGPARGTGMGTNLNLPPETVSKEQRIFHGWDPDAQRKKNNRRKAGTAVATTAGVGSAVLATSAANDVRRADRELGESRRAKEPYQKPPSSAQRPGYVDEDWGRTPRGQQYGNGAGTSNFGQQNAADKGAKPGDPTNREKRDRVRAEQRKNINDRAFQAGRNSAKKDNANPLKETRENLKALGSKAKEAKYFKTKVGGALGLAALAGTSYKVSRDD